MYALLTLSFKCSLKFNFSSIHALCPSLYAVLISELAQLFIIFTFALMKIRKFSFSQYTFIYAKKFCTPIFDCTYTAILFRLAQLSSTGNADISGVLTSTGDVGL